MTRACPDSPSRLEAIAKVTGRARYAADLAAQPPGGHPVHAAVVQSPQAGGRVLAIDTADALAIPGVHRVITHLDAPRLKPIHTMPGGELGRFLPLQDNRLHYSGQPIALVMADSAQIARYAASRVKVRYSPAEREPLLTLSEAHAKNAEKVGAGLPGLTERGTPDAAFTGAARQLDETYETVPQHHNALEPGAVVAEWDGEGRLVVHTATQYSYGDAYALAQAFDLGVNKPFTDVMSSGEAEPGLDDKVRLIVPFVGGAFGGKKGNLHPLLAAMAAKLVGRPVCLELTRSQTFSLMPFRGGTRQRIRLGGDADGRLRVLIQDALIQNSALSNFIEPVGEMTPKLYACEHLRTSHRAVEMDINAPSWMRAPGVGVSQFAIESAMDEWAHEIGLDPLDVRLRNYAEVEPQKGHPWSSKALRECYRQAAEAIGWNARDPRVGSMREHGQCIGLGMATAIYHVAQMAASARVRLNADGSAQVSSSTHELGQGGLTALSQIAAQALGVPLARLNLQWGDTRLPYSSLTAGSSTTLSLGAAITAAAEQLRQQLAERAVADIASPLHGLAPQDLRLANCALCAADGRAQVITELLRRQGLDGLAAQASTGGQISKPALGRATFGAQFAKVAVDPVTGVVRVQRLVGAFAGGRVVNPMLARSQLMGGMVWGLGQALFEHTRLDERLGRWMNADLAEAMIATHADVPTIDVLMVEEDDRRGHPLGIKGLGEIGIVGVAPAIANAVFHATGVRIRSLPLTPDKLLAQLP